VAKAINALTVDTPLFKCGGDIPASAIGTTDGGVGGGIGGGIGGDDGNEDNPSSASAAKATNNHNQQQMMMSSSSTAIITHNDSNPTSFAAVHLQLHKKNKAYHKKYIEHILTYASDWERILSTRVNKHLKHAEKLRVDLDHYQKKVEELNKDANKTMTKGKSVSDKGVDKLKRNEQKLVNARREHEQFVSDLCGFMEEIMERGWKDLHPLLVKMAQFDVTLSGEEAKLLSTGMVAVVGELKVLAGKHPNMNPTGRLKELETWSLESINKTNPRSVESQQLTITGGDEYGAVQRASEDELDVGGGGLFGSAPNSRQHSSDNLYGNVQNSRQPSTDNLSRNGTGDSFDWNAGVAPPDSTALVPTTVSPPSSGYGLPPLPRQSSNGVASPTHGSSSSMVPMLNTMQAAAPPPTLNDIFGGGAAPTPPAAAPHSGYNQPTGGGMMHPPPPVMPPPPPPPQSPSTMGTPMQMYNSSPMVNTSHMYNSSPMTQPPTISSPMNQQHPPTLGMNQMSLGNGGAAMAPPASSNPFDNQGQHAPKPPTNPFEF